MDGSFDSINTCIACLENLNRFIITTYLVVILDGSMSNKSSFYGVLGVVGQELIPDETFYQLATRRLYGK